MSIQGRLVEGVKEKFAIEVHDTKVLDIVQRKIMEYFDIIGSALKNEFENAKSLDFEINEGDSSFLKIKIGDTGLEFIRKTDVIEVKEVIVGGVRDYDTIFVKNKAVVTEIYFKTTFTTDVLDKYVQQIFGEYLARETV